ncbi:aldose epimerase family protein, partial [Chryseobacterium contaminans]
MRKTIDNSIFILLFLIIFGCKKENNKQDISGKMENVHTSGYGVTPKGDSIKKYTLTNKNGMKVEVINFGGIITSLTAPDRNGKYEDVVLGFTKPEGYFDGNPYYFGALIGRYGNRIANAKFSLEGKAYEIDKNDGPNSLHGGKEG